MQALEGIRILDLSGGIAGPLGVRQLAEHGADVIKIEPPGGRRDRTSPASRAYNRSRRSVTLNLKDQAGKDLFRELCGTADILVEAFATGTMAKLGFGFTEIRDEFPRLIYCSIPAWPTGTRYQDRSGYEALVQARTGQHWEHASFRSGPVFLHSPVASLGAMFLVPIAIMAALRSRDSTGRGQHVEVSLLQGAMSLNIQNWNWTDKGQFMLDKRYPGIHQATIFECADGKWIHACTIAGIATTRSEADVLGIEDVSHAVLSAMPAAPRKSYEKKRRAAYLNWDRDLLIKEFHAAGLGAEAIVSPHERFDHPQLKASGSVVELIDPEVGPMRQIGSSIFLERTPAVVHGPQPIAGTHTEEVLSELGYAASELAALRANGII